MEPSDFYQFIYMTLILIGIVGLKRAAWKGFLA